MTLTGLNTLIYLRKSRADLEAELLGYTHVNAHT